jgi:hypothetical protein
MGTGTTACCQKPLGRVESNVPVGRASETNRYRSYVYLAFGACPHYYPISKGHIAIYRPDKQSGVGRFHTSRRQRPRAFRPTTRNGLGAQGEGVKPSSPATPHPDPPA